jgi:hypothetical protein
MDFFDVKTTFLDGRVKYYEGERIAGANFEIEALADALLAGWVAQAGAEGAALAEGVEASIEIHAGGHEHAAPEVN